MTTYDNSFYELIASGSSSSAAIIAPLVYSTYSPTSVIDIGCGTGVWAKAFETLGAYAVGVDGAYVENPVIDNFIAHDISVDLPATERFGLAVCLEVAEHLPESRAGSFVAELCAKADVVLFSAAIPFQTGTHHINCQWQSYWAQHFADNGYGPVDWIRWEVWNNPMVEPWYRQNTILYEMDAPAKDVYDVVHRDIHYWGR